MNDFRLLYVSKIKSNINPINDLYDILTEVESGTRPLPESYEEIEPELPELKWPNE